VITQHMPNGQWRVYQEVLAEMGTGASRFGELLAQVLRDRYEGWRTINLWADPSAAYGADKEAGEQTWIEIVSAKIALPILSAPTNNAIARWEAVRRPLTRLIDGGPGMLLDPQCSELRKGFNSDYRFRLLQIPGPTPRYDEKAEKNAASHPHDALQYACS